MPTFRSLQMDKVKNRRCGALLLGPRARHQEGIHQARAGRDSARFAAPRRDKYEKNLREYYVDVHTSATTEHENEESLMDTTHGEGDAGGLQVGLPPSPLNMLMDEKDEEAVTDQELDDEDGVSVRSSRKVPSKSEVEKESALEAGSILFQYFHLNLKIYVGRLGLGQPFAMPGDRECPHGDRQPPEGSGADDKAKGKPCSLAPG